MKTVICLSFSLVGFVGLSGLTNMVYAPKVLAGEERSIAAHEHDKVKFPTKRLMIEIEKRVYNILEGILIGDFKYVKQEATVVSEKANQISENFFPREPYVDTWYKRSKDIEPSNIEAIKKLKEEFNSYVRRIDAGVQDIQKAADSNDAEATFNAFSGLLTKACFECHRQLQAAPRYKINTCPGD